MQNKEEKEELELQLEHIILLRSSFRFIKLEGITYIHI